MAVAEDVGGSSVLRILLSKFRGLGLGFRIWDSKLRFAEHPLGSQTAGK